MIPSIELDSDSGAAGNSWSGTEGGPPEGEDCVWSGGQGSEEAFVMYFGGLLQRLVASTLRRLRLKPADVAPEDLLQEAYCRLFERGLRTFVGMAPGQIVMYLRRVVRTTLLSRLRADRAQKRGRDWQRDHSPVWYLVDTELTPEGRVLEREARAQLLRGCRWLADQTVDDRRRNAWVMLRVLAGGWTSREVATASGSRVSPSSVDSLMWRCRRKLEAQEAPQEAVGRSPSESAPHELPEAIHHILRLAMQRRSRTGRQVC